MSKLLWVPVYSITSSCSIVNLVEHQRCWLLTFWRGNSKSLNPLDGTFIITKLYITKFRLGKFSCSQLTNSDRIICLFCHRKVQHWSFQFTAFPFFLRLNFASVPESFRRWMFFWLGQEEVIVDETFISCQEDIHESSARIQRWSISVEQHSWRFVVFICLYCYKSPITESVRKIKEANWTGQLEESRVFAGTVTILWKCLD